ncbi:hypothetical protein FKM82_020285 [Ascaphus truei]
MSFHSGNFLSSSSNSYMGGLTQSRRSYSTSSSHSGSNGSWSSLGPAKVLSSSGAGGYDFVRDSGESLLTNDEKGTMQNLNDRLASYLEKVRSLEETNAQLEDKIQEWHKSRAPEKKRDYKGYEKVIVDLQAQLANGHMNGAKLTLQMENAKLAADDFKRKYAKLLISLLHR